MTLTAIERLTTEYENLTRERKYLFFANPISTSNKLNLFNWECSFPGPNIDLYKNSYYYVTITFSKEYPFKAPRVKFKNFVFHPNIYKDGSVCLDILQSKWKSSFGIMKILTALQSLLMEPNINSPANGEVSSILQKSKVKYCKKVRNNIENFHLVPEYMRRME